ncbi:MAG: sulfurtransferase-like selenium metabolism protein YedF, partial [Christensenellaceae bacterium]|nr:sulfurtransferase-like selenium metabolism protein YedF [Christensenellaceae bacterium]
MLGQPGPMPVVNARRALADPDVDAVCVLVDNKIAGQNLEKMASQLGYACSFERRDGHYRVIVARDRDAAFAPIAETSNQPKPARASAGATVLIARDALGGGSEELGRLLMKGFIFSLTELDPPPREVIFINGGAHLTSEGANTLPDLMALVEKGARIYTCGTCLNYYGLMDHLAVGEVADMMRIAGMLNGAARLISL